jgi:hypothetical protein
MPEARTRVAALVGGSCLAAAWACYSVGCGVGGGDHGSTSVDGGVLNSLAAFSDADTPNVSDAGPAGVVCAHYYAAQYSRCGGPVLPASEEARQQARFVQACLNEIALPGSGMTIAAVEACASALDVSACELPDGPPVACNFSGTLPGGAACNEGRQCMSGQCQGTVFLSPEGPLGPTTCGTCASFAEAGQVCAQGHFTAGCAAGQTCQIGAGMETASMPTYTCVPTIEGDAGTACDEDPSRTCAPGLYCAAQTGQCQPLGDAGARCGQGAMPPGNPGGCQAPLSCVGNPGMTSCSLGDGGAFCLEDYDCSPGLGCVSGPCAPSCSASGTCQSVTWAWPGQTCDAYRTRCLVGSCSVESGIGPPLVQYPDGGLVTGTCPTISTDGQPCNSQCDAFAECFSSTGKAGASGLMGTCTLLDSIVCQ